MDAVKAQLIEVGGRTRFAAYDRKTSFATLHLEPPEARKLAGLLYGEVIVTRPEDAATKLTELHEEALMLDALEKAAAVEAIEDGRRAVKRLITAQAAIRAPFAAASLDRPAVRFEVYERELAYAGFEIVRRR